VAVFRHGGMDWAASGFTAGPWLLAVAIVAVYQISFSPYVSDYSRYLPSNIGYRRPFWWTYLGTAASGVWVMALGAILAVQYPEDGSVQAVSKVAGGSKWFIQLIFALAIIGINAMNLYGGMLSILTGISAFRDVGRGVVFRIVATLAVFAVALTLALAASADFVTNFQNFLLFVVYIFIPWTAVNLADFYIVRRGRYDVKAFFDRKGIYFKDPATRMYGGFSLNAMAAYVIGFISEIPFINTTYWKGWAVDSLDGADISWIVGLIVTTAVYLVLARGVAKLARA
jgi:purine-cytosine permease-like protein